MKVRQLTVSILGAFALLQWGMLLSGNGAGPLRHPGRTGGADRQDRPADR